MSFFHILLNWFRPFSGFSIAFFCCSDNFANSCLLSCCCAASSCTPASVAHEAPVQATLQVFPCIIACVLFTMLNRIYLCAEGCVIPASSLWKVAGYPSCVRCCSLLQFPRLVAQPAVMLNHDRESSIDCSDDSSAACQQLVTLPQVVSLY